jgi:hypothetical protein
MPTFIRKRIAVLHSQQPSNQYAGGATGQPDSEQAWMRKLATEVTAELAAAGHDAILSPLAHSYADNVKWVNGLSGVDFLISLHSNATGKSEAQAKGTVGIGIYHHSNSARGQQLALSLLPFLKSASAAGKAYVSTITVAEVASTTPPALLVENEYHDWVGSPTTGGADWIRDAGNRTRLAKAYRAWVVSMYGEKVAPPPVVTPPPVVVPPSTSLAFTAATYNVQSKRFGGGVYSADAAFVRDILKPAVLFVQEADSQPDNTGARDVIAKATGLKVYPVNYVAVMFDPDVVTWGPKIPLTFDSKGVQGAVATELTSKANGAKLVACSVHVRPNDAIPGTTAQKLAGKKADVAKVIKLLAPFPNVMVGGDWSTEHARTLLLAAGYRQVTPNVNTYKTSKLDSMWVKGTIADATGGSTHKTPASDHRGLVANLNLPAPIPTN